MYLKERISLLKYSIGTLANASIVSYLGSSNLKQIYFQLFILVSAAINQIMLLLVTKILLDFEDRSKSKNIKVFAMMIGKTLLLGLAFYTASQKIPEKLLSCVLIYIFQLIILTLSIKRLPN